MSDGQAIDYCYLKKCSLFGGVTEEAFEHIRPLICVQHFEKGACIIEESHVNDRIYFIQEGAVEIHKVSIGPGNHGLRHIITMGCGDTFGEMELIDIQPCAATVQALEPTMTLSLSNHDLYRIAKIDMKTYALLIMNLARELSRRLRQTDDLLAGTEDPHNNSHDGRPP